MQPLAQDVWRFCALLTVAATLGFAGNYVRQPSLPLVYHSKASRLDYQVQTITRNSPTVAPTTAATVTNAGVSIISLEQFQKYAQGSEALVLDARPAVFYGMGHVPGALSLPRDDFEAAHARLKSQLEKNRGRPLAVYCSDADCDDSELVAKALLKLGYPQVLRFKDGWAAWQKAHLPEEQTP